MKKHAHSVAPFATASPNSASSFRPRHHQLASFLGKQNLTKATSAAQNNSG